MRLFIKSLVVSLTFIFCGWLSLAPAVSAQTCDPSDTKSALKCGTGGDSGVPGGASDPASSLSQTIETGINLGSAIVGIVAVVMIIIAAVRFVASGGNENGVKAAKQTLAYALVGLIIVALAQLIVHFVINTIQNPSSSTGSSTSSSSSGGNTPGNDGTPGPGV